MRLGLLVICAACGRLDFDPAGNPESDGDVPLSACWATWHSGALQLSAPEPIAELADPGSCADPSLSADGLTMYFSRGNDLVVSRRATRSSSWQAPIVLAELSSSGDDAKLSVTSDGLLVIWSSTRSPSMGYDLWQATRSTPEAPFGTPTSVPLSTLNDGLHQYDPHISADGLRLYYAPVLGSTQQVRVATRASRTGAFGEPMEVALGPNLTADPTLSPDELVIVYTAQQSGVLQMYYATRNSPTESFGVGQLLPIYNDGPVADRDPALSYDGCELYFASRRGGGDLQLYVTRVQ